MIGTRAFVVLDVFLCLIITKHSVSNIIMIKVWKLMFVLGEKGRLHWRWPQSARAARAEMLLVTGLIVALRDSHHQIFFISSFVHPLTFVFLKSVYGSLEMPLLSEHQHSFTPVCSKFTIVSSWKYNGPKTTLKKNNKAKTLFDNMSILNIKNNWVKL